MNTGPPSRTDEIATLPPTNTIAVAPARRAGPVRRDRWTADGTGGEMTGAPDRPAGEELRTPARLGAYWFEEKDQFQPDDVDQ